MYGNGNSLNGKLKDWPADYWGEEQWPSGFCKGSDTLSCDACVRNVSLNFSSASVVILIVHFTNPNAGVDRGLMYLW